MRTFYSALLIKVTLAVLLSVAATNRGFAQTNETLSSGSFIVNMGVVPQTIGNGLKPYGLLYDLLKNYNVPVKWVISGTKGKDGVDFTYAGVDYKGGPFIIPAEYRSATVNARITFWQSQGVQGTTTTAPITVPVYTTLLTAPRWTLDKQNGGIAVTFMNNGGIPPAAYGGSSSSGWKNAADLNCCDDLFIMPHADPTWLTHGNLFDWNANCDGAIWLACHAGSALENMFDNVAPVDYNKQTNFLAEKTGPASGAGPYSENALLLWGNHDDGTLPYSYDFPNDPVMQFLGIIDAATQNGSEQIYIPKGAGWRPTTKVGVYDPDHPNRYLPYINPKHRAAVVAWGDGFGDPDRGKVMLEASHSVAKATAPANIAAQRIFFNFSFLAATDKAVIPTMSGLPAVVNPGVPYPLSFSVPPPANPGDYIATWSASCGGTFTPSNTGQNVTFTPATVPAPTNCIVTVVISDNCGRQTFVGNSTTVECNVQVTPTITQPCFGSPNSGVISMAITNASPAYGYSWAKSGGGTGSGSGTTISGLSAGTYTVTVTTSGGTGCTKTFTATITQLPQINITATPVAVKCNGGATGAINVSVTGGTPGYTYNWGGGVTTQNRSGLTVGTYTVTVTDSKNCTATQSVTVTQPAALAFTATPTNVNCFGQSSGSINLAVSGGTSPYTYLWSNGNTSQNNSGLPAGTYSVTVTDANNCTATSTNISITQPAAALSLTSSQTNVACYGGNTGSITVTATGGTSPYNYDWSGTPSGDGTPTITNLVAGTYSVTVTDNKGCTEVLTTTITQSSALSISTAVTPPTCPPNAQQNNSNGAIDLTVSGGAPGYTYDWADLPGVSNPEDRTGLQTGTYTVTVTDNNGCTASISVELNNLNPNPAQPGAIEH